MLPELQKIPTFQSGPDVLYMYAYIPACILVYACVYMYVPMCRCWVMVMVLTSALGERGIIHRRGRRGSVEQGRWTLVEARFGAPMSRLQPPLSSRAAA